MLLDYSSFERVSKIIDEHNYFTDKYSNIYLPLVGIWAAATLEGAKHLVNIDVAHDCLSVLEDGASSVEILLESANSYVAREAAELVDDQDLLSALGSYAEHLNNMEIQLKHNHKLYHKGFFMNENLDRDGKEAARFNQLQLDLDALVRDGIASHDEIPYDYCWEACTSVPWKDMKRYAKSS